MKRKTFLPVLPESGIKDNHLHVIISDPDIDNNVMVVNITTFYCTGREDRSCIIKPGEHPFIVHNSYVPYNYAKEVNCIKLLNEKLKNKIIFKDDVSLGLLQRIQEGAKKTNRLPLLFKKYFSQF